MSRRFRRLSSVCPYSLIFGADGTRAIPAFKPENREMAPRDRLKMIREGVIERRPARRAEQRNALGHNLLRDNCTNMAADLFNQTDKRRRNLASSAAHGKIACRFGVRLRQYGANREIAGFQD